MMIVFLNGPFGVGKSATARLLSRRLPNALCYNPEYIGSVVHPLARAVSPVEDYQDLWLWRWLTAQIARLLIGVTGKTLVMPMSVTRPEHFAEIVGRWRRSGVEVRCFWLAASEGSLRQRILPASESGRARSWRLAHMAAGLAASGDSTFGEPVPTDGRTPAEVADSIAAMLRRTRPAA